ncbi:MAG TPA: DUF348 domain-containing protein [Chloroflexi bacterium]|nr:DUF348 domain-containing protein [Chloroflexota bacterium]
MSDRRLPMPGEKPVTVYRPRQPKARNPWFRVHPSRLWRWLPFALLVLGLVAGLELWRATGTPVTVVLNGQPVRLRTHRRTVAGAVRAAGVRAAEAVYVEPPPETPLEPDMVITLAALHPVIVHLDGQTYLSVARSADPREIVAALGIADTPRDVVRIERSARPTGAEIAASPALAEVPALPREISVVRPQVVIVNEVHTATGEETRVSLETTARTLGEALAGAGYVLYEADRVSLPLGTPVTNGIEVTIERATPVTVQADGRTFETRTHRLIVSALLEELGLALNGDDYVLPAPDTPLVPGERVRLVRVREEMLTEEEPIPYQTLYVPDPDLELDQQRVVQAGQPGLLARRVRVRYEDGVAVSRVVAGEWEERPPRPEVVHYGTRIVIRTLQTPYGELAYWRRLTVLATSYSPRTAGDKQPGDPFYGLSATGAEVVRGIVAVDPRVISLGTRLYVPGYGVGTALDVGGAVKGLRVDLGYDDANLVLWNNWVDIYLLLPVPPPDQIAWVLPE